MLGEIHDMSFISWSINWITMCQDLIFTRSPLFIFSYSQEGRSIFVALCFVLLYKTVCYLCTYLKINS